jgi:hypothetical protein
MQEHNIQMYFSVEDAKQLYACSLYHLSRSSDVNRRPIGEKRKCIDALEFQLTRKGYQWTLLGFQLMLLSNAIIHMAISGNAGH